MTINTYSQSSIKEEAEVNYHLKTIFKQGSSCHAQVGSLAGRK